MSKLLQNSSALAVSKSNGCSKNELSSILERIVIPTLSSKSPVQFCESHSISRPTFHRLIAAGKLEARKVGSRTIITSTAEQAWLDSLPLAHTPAPLEA